MAQDREDAEYRALTMEIRLLLTEKGWSQKDLADRIGTRRETVSEDLTATKERGMPFRRLVAIAQALEVSLEELTRRAHERAVRGD
ncbi:helix-turn-helix transcriptional regulator [Sinomonas soli]